MHADRLVGCTTRGVPGAPKILRRVASRSSRIILRVYVSYTACVFCTAHPHARIARGSFDARRPGRGYGLEKVTDSILRKSTHCANGFQSQHTVTRTGRSRHRGQDPSRAAPLSPSHSPSRSAACYYSVPFEGNLLPRISALAAAAPQPRPVAKLMSPRLVPARAPITRAPPLRRIPCGTRRCSRCSSCAPRRRRAPRATGCTWRGTPARSGSHSRSRRARRVARSPSL